jgi:hypothetical protein
VELHGGSGDGDAALLFHAHPVAGGELAALAGAHHPGGPDHAGIQEQFFREGGFTRVGMADDGERPPFGDLRAQFWGWGVFVHRFKSRIITRGFRLAET